MIDTKVDNVPVQILNFSIEIDYGGNLLTVASRKNPALFSAFSGKMKNGFRPKYI